MGAEAWRSGAAGGGRAPPPAWTPSLGLAVTAALVLAAAVAVVATLVREERAELGLARGGVEGKGAAVPSGGSAAASAAMGMPPQREPPRPRRRRRRRTHAPLVTSLPTTPSPTLSPTTKPTGPTSQPTTLPPRSAPPVSAYPFSRFAPPASRQPQANASSPRKEEEEEDGRRWGPMIRRLRGHRVLVVQTDTRLSGALRGNPPAKQNFTSTYYAVTPVIVQRWAEEQGAAYVFFASPPTCVGPVPQQSMIAYWCKVPAILYALRVAAAAEVPYVLFLDSDVLPSDPRYSINNTLVAWFETHPETHMILNPDHDYYVVLVGNANAYRREAINSGTISLRVSEQTWGMVWRWWFELTQRPSLLETRLSSVVLHYPGVVNASFRTNRTLAMERLVQGLGYAAVQILSLGGNDKMTWIEIRPDPFAPNFTDTALWDEHLPRCCQSAACAAPFGGAEPVQCRKNPFSTIESWPGDQDRLNWLMDLERDKFAFISTVAYGCIRDGETGENELVMHVCDNDYVKRVYAQRAAVREMRRLRFMAPFWELTDAELAPQEEERRQAVWEREGWAHLRRTVRWFALPAWAHGWTADLVLQRVLDRGNVELGGPWAPPPPSSKSSLSVRRGAEPPAG